MLSDTSVKDILTKIYNFNYSSLNDKLDFNFLYKNRVVPYDEDNYSIFCVSDSYDNNIVSNMEYMLKKDCKLNIISNEDMNLILKVYSNKINNLKKSNKLRLFKIESSEDKSNSEIINYINELLEYSINNNVTDIHIEPFEENIRIRIRIDGALLVKDYINKDFYSVIITRTKIQAKLDISERRLPQDGRITFNYNDKSIDLRISMIPTIHGEKITIRILDSENKYKSLNSLGMSKVDSDYIKNEINKLSGMMLVCGPTNSGKTTTIYSLLNEINKENINIVTLEDPVEYKIYGINQIQINNRQGLMFNNTLRNILRADPEIISIGEIRDEETVQTGLRAAITGHYVFSTIHTRNSISAIFRLKDMKAKEYLISSALNTIISQRLIRILCDNCKEKSNEDLSRYNIKQHYLPVGCSKCNNGYKGRMGVFEIFKIDEDIKSLINSGGTYNEILNKAKSKGFKTLEENLIEKVNLGVTSFDEIIKLI